MSVESLWVRPRQVSDALRVYGMLAASADKGGVRVLPDWA